MKKVVVIGGGASGLVAAIFAARKQNDVTILEKNNICGKKILVTGNGRCNFWNEDQDIMHYRSLNLKYLTDVLTTENKEIILKFFKQIGIEPKIKNGYYYPFSNQAVSMQNALITEVKRLNIKVELNAEVKNIEKNKNGFNIFMQNGKKCIADKVILATGSKAAPKTGSDGIGYDICKNFNHTIIKPLPALVQLKTNGTFLKEWDGVRADVLVTYLENNQRQAEEKGEIQLTNYGVSGICVFNLSGRIARGLDLKKKEQIEINFLEGLGIKNIDDFINWMENREKTVKERNIAQLLEGVLNYKLVNVLINQSKLNTKSKWKSLNIEQKKELAKNITRFKLDITETNSFDKAQVCTGGVDLKEIDTNTMQSKKVEDLYITGELLDVDGDCGGYNLEWAWITGMIAGMSVE